jgi:5-methylcytosine-specific restriction endonuclease McrA
MTESYIRWKEKLGPEGVKAAWKAGNARYYQKNRDRVLQAHKRYEVSLTPEQRRERQKIADLKHIAKRGRDVLRARRRELDDLNPERRQIRNQRKKASPKYKPRRQRNEAKRRARTRAATIGDLTDIQKIYDRCNELRQWFKVVVDHIIPLALGGAHEASNLQIIYGFENARKGIRPDYKPKVIFT